jgi:hypothetical protein
MNPHSYTNLKDPKHSTQKLLYKINSSSNVAGYKINFKKSVARVDSKMAVRGKKQKASLL